MKDAINQALEDILKVDQVWIKEELEALDNGDNDYARYIRSYRFGLSFAIEILKREIKSVGETK